MSLVLTAFDETTGVGRLTLNRPDVLNAIDVPMARAFLAATLKLTALPGLRAIVLTGAGRAFGAGGDVAAFTARGLEQAGDVVNDLLDALNPAILALRGSPAPVITAVRGVAAGAGLSLALLGDLIVAEENARFVIAYDKIGASPDCGLTWFLPRRVGCGKAFNMMLSGEVLTAGEALAGGLADRLATKAEFDAVVDELGLKAASGPTLAFGRYKALLDSGPGLADHLEAERAAFIGSTRTSDFAEGVASFAAKRPPAFLGR